jgi:hypothetical protein
MPKGRSKLGTKPASQPETLKGWKEIAEYLGEPVSVLKRWRSEGMPVFEQGRFVSSSAKELNAWLGRESGKPVHVVTPETDLSSELKRGIAFARREKNSEKRSR